MTKRKIAIAIAAAALAGTCAIGGTLAWLTSTDEVRNTFTVGNVMIDVTENGKTDTSNSYTIAPGDPFAKDPGITLKAGSQDSYVFATIVNTTKDDSRIDPVGISNEEGTKTGNWTLIDYARDEVTGKTTHVYRYTGPLATAEGYVDVGEGTSAAEDISLGTLFTQAMLNKDYDTTENTATINIDGDIVVNGYAIQAASFDSWEEAYGALVTDTDIDLPALD